MCSDFLDMDLLPASEYNHIKCFEEQRTIGQKQLSALAELYVRAKMHHSYGAGILHRHIPLRDGHIMVHTLCDDDIDICKAESVTGLDYDNITPHSLYLNSKGQFQAYEYDSGVKTPRLLPSIEFLRQLRSFLVENHLTDLVAVLAEDGRQNSVEFLLPNEQGMICIPYKDVYGGIDMGRSVITGWKFCEEPDGRILCVERNECDPKGDGQHIVYDAATFCDRRS
jgi:hypothetical protein